MMAYVMLINQVRSSKSDCTDLAIIGQPWSLTQLKIQECVRPVKSMQIHTPTPRSTPLHSCFIAIWSMEIDVIGPISPPSAKDYRFILVITDYFSKWAEVVPFVEVKTTNVVNFIKYHVIHWFGVPRRIIHDNGPQFASQSFYRFLR